MGKGHKEDLRILRTRKMLSESLIKLLETTSYDKISVIDICDRAMVHRATFYNHFADKEDLLSYAIDGIKEELYSQTIKKENYTNSKEMYMSLISQLIDFVNDHKTTLQSILNNNSKEQISELLNTTIKRSLRYLNSKNNYGEKTTIPKNVLIDFFSGGITSLGICWLQDPSQYTKEQLLEYFNILLDERIYVSHN